MTASGPLGPALRNARHERFAREYAAVHDAAEAARRSGYSSTRAKQQGHDLLRRPEVRRRVEELDAERAAELGIEAEDVIRTLLEVQRRASIGVPRTYRDEMLRTDDGEPIMVPDWPSVIRATLALAQIAGVLRPKAFEPEAGFVFRLALDTDLDEIGVGEGYDLDAASA